MKTYTDEGLYEDAKFEAWNEVLAPLGRLRCQGRLGGGAGSELMEPLYDIAQEMRDRLRFSQLRMHQLKSDVRKMQGLLTMERQHAAEAITEERLQAQAAQLQVQEQLLCDKDKVQALLRQAQEELQREKRQAQEDLQREREKGQAMLWQAQEELRVERSRSQDALDKQHQRAREHLEVECKAAQEHAAAECRRAHEALRQVEEQLREERSRGTDERVQERQKAAAKMAELETQVRQLSKAVQDQDSQISSQQRLNTDLQSEMATARYGTSVSSAKLDQAEDRADRAADRADRAEAAQRELGSELATLRLELEGWRQQAAKSDDRHSSTVQALLDTKSQLGELSHLQGLYLAAREELGRLDMENTELKEMMQGEVYELSKSRILETMSPSRQEKSSPLYLTPELTGRRRTKSNRRQARSISPGRDRVLAATGVIYPPDVADSIEAGLIGAAWPPPPAHDGLGYVAEAAQLAQLAFLGPPTSSYPTDPDKFVFVRVAGGFSPKYVGSEPLPKASGWIPKQVVRLAQAFKHSHAINLEWRAWEPFLLLVNEVYHAVGGGQYHGGQYGSGAYLKAGGRATKGDMTATMAYRPASAKMLSETAQQELELPSSEATRLHLSRMASYPSVLQAERIMALRKELARSRSRGRSGGARSAREERERDAFVRTMAEKDYHILNELGEVVGDNQRLRRSMQYAD